MSYNRPQTWLLAAFTALAISPADAAEPAAVAIEVAKAQIDFRIGKELVATYHTGTDVAKPYLWPILGPNNTPLTRAWPMQEGAPNQTTDHKHQKSAWFCHGDVIPEGIELKNHIRGVEGVDFWSESTGHGSIVCKKIGDARQEKNHGRVTTSNEWQAADGTKILDEIRTIHLYNFGDTQLLVFDIDLHASVAPVTFGDTKEGSFGIRINDSITEKSGKGKLENADGKTGMKQVWGQRSKWCDYSGPLGGTTMGLAILDDPRNPYPATWHSRDYGLMAANPFGRDKSGFAAVKGNTDLVKLAKGDHLKLRYGLLIHPGDAKAGKVASYYEQFVKLRE